MLSTAQQDPEREIERLAREIGHVVGSADPERQDQHKELVSTLVDQELAPIGTSNQTAAPAVRRPLNPLAVGLGLLVLGVALFFLVPPIAIMLGIVGFFGITWGAVMSWTVE